MRRHHDANQIFKLLVAREIASLVEADASLIDAAQCKLADMRSHPCSGRAVAIWTQLLRQPVAVIAEVLRRDDAQGDDVREAMPGFAVISKPLRAHLVEESRRLYAEERR